MITVKKLYTLKTGTRLRKIVRILEEWETDILRGGLPDFTYLKDLLGRMSCDEDLGEIVRQSAEDLSHKWDPTDIVICRRLINSLRHAMLSRLEVAPADWDFIHPGDQDSRKERNFFPGVAVYLDEIRSPFNVGSIFRTAESMGVSEILLSPGTADPLHSRAQRTAMGCVDKIVWRRLDYTSLELLDRDIFALELGGVGVNSFDFPREGILVLGSEEVGVSPECLKLADSSKGRASIPLYGWKGSLNVSVAYGIVMNLWAASLSV